MPLADGQSFAGYTIEGTLGVGGMGEVYLAKHPRLPRRDALKVLGTEVSHDDEYRQRFNQEAEMVATLHHPNIVTIYDRGDYDGSLWIAMEFVDGTDASRLLTEVHPRGIPAAEVVRIVNAVADALDHAHSHQLLHRDIKPANILLGRPESGDGAIMLADFGVARWVGQPSDLTGSDMTVGTVTYAAPEQLKGEMIDGRADQYALAATAFHLLTGAAPFANSNPAVVISSHLSAAPPVIGEQRPDLALFGSVFARALAKDPAQRYGSCRDFAADLADALATDGGTTPRHRKPTSASRRRWVAAALGAVLIVGGAGAVFWARQGAPDGRPGPATPPPPAVSARMDLPVVVIGAECAVLGSAAVDETGAPAYCARPDPQGQGTVWSPQPERFRVTGPAVDGPQTTGPQAPS